MESVSDIFEALNGPTKVAIILGVKTSAAGMMKHRGSIPVKYWSDLVAALADQGVALTYVDLVRLHSKKAA